MDPQVQACIDMLKKRPSLAKFGGNSENLKNISTSYNSDIFGDSVLLPVGSQDKKGGLRYKLNPLEEEIKRVQVNYLYGGYFYDIESVKVYKDEEEKEEATYCDIAILVESIDDLEEMKQFKKLSDMTIQERTQKGQLYLQDIIKAVNGYGRIIQYKANGEFTPKNLTVEYVQEGRFREGVMDGYCRMFDGRDAGKVELGYFKEGKPLGKYQSFSISGQQLEEGIKEGDNLVKDIVISSYQTRVLKNDQPAGHLSPQRSPSKKFKN